MGHTRSYRSLGQLGRHLVTDSYIFGVLDDPAGGIANNGVTTGQGGEWTDALEHTG